MAVIVLLSLAGSSSPAALSSSPQAQPVVRVFLAPSPPDQPNPPEANFAAIAVNHLQVSRWQGAFDPGVITPPTFLPPFPNRQDERFLIQIADPSLMSNGTTDTITVVLQTLFRFVNEGDHDFLRFKMGEIEDSGVFRSKAFILTSNVVDDSSFDQNPAADGKDGDVTIRVLPGPSAIFSGKVRIIYKGVDEVPVTEPPLSPPALGVKRARVRFTILRINGVPIMSETGGLGEVGLAHELWAQANIVFLTENGVVFTPERIHLADAPAGFDYTDGVKINDSDGDEILTDEAAAIVDQLGDADPSTIDVFYVGKVFITRSDGVVEEVRGEALRGAGGIMPPLRRNIVFIGDRAFNTLAHELGHILTGGGHPDLAGTPEVFVNLMSILAGRTNLPDLGFQPGEDSVLGAKRLRPAQTQAARTQVPEVYAEP